MISLLLKRGRDERLAQGAGGLTLTTILSMVPLLAVSFALFTRVPRLRSAGDAIREHLLSALLPADIARTVLRHLAQFTGNAGGLTLVGSSFLLVSALALLLSVENTLNRLWQAKPRPVGRRLVLYLAMLLTGPVILGAILWAMSALVARSGRLAAGHPDGLQYVLEVGPVLLAAVGFACLFRSVPNTDVRWRNALAAGLLAGIAFECGKRGFAFYLAHVPTYRTIYGAFAPLLAFLLWVYYSWFVTLAVGLVCASLPGAARSTPAAARSKKRPASRR